MLYHGKRRDWGFTTTDAGPDTSSVRCCGISLGMGTRRLADSRKEQNIQWGQYGNGRYMDDNNKLLIIISLLASRGLVMWLVRGSTMVFKSRVTPGHETIYHSTTLHGPRYACISINYLGRYRLWTMDYGLMRGIYKDKRSTHFAHLPPRQDTPPNSTP
jgi:hypothetical protein